MIPFQFKVRYGGAIPGITLKGRELNDMKREAWIETGNYWHANFRKKHFTHAGATLYGYAPRKKSYQTQKLRRKGHTIPLVYSGESRALTRIRDVRATATNTRSKCRVVIHAPGLNRRHPNSEIDMRAEMTAVSGTEGQVLIRLFDNTMGRRLQRFRGTVTKRIQ